MWLTSKIFGLFSNIRLRIYNRRLIKKCQIGRDSRFTRTAVISNGQSQSSIIIGDECLIEGELLVYPFGDGIKIGNNCYIGQGTRIRSAECICIGSNVLISHGVNIFDTNSHEMNSIERMHSAQIQLKQGLPKTKGNVETAPIVIEDNVWISFNVTILKGVRIGQGAIIGAGSVVTKDVPSYTLAVGNPARPVKKVE
jgi:acetyltransferase-like isoleucine patch superfamily enzyme